MIVTDVLVQGLVSACEGSGLAMGVAVERKFQSKKDHIKINNLEIKPRIFVDDVASADGDAAAARDSGDRLTEALNSMRLEAHPTKSVRVTSGPAAPKRKLVTDLAKNPQRIQGAEIKEASSEKYLGLIFGDKSHRQNLNRNIELKRSKIIAKVKTIKRLLNNPAILRMGWLRAAVGFIQSIIVSTQMYGMESFINMTKKNVKDFEKIQKDAIYDIIGLSRSANYNAVLAEIGVLRAEETVKLRKISFVNKLIHTRKSCECRDVLQEADNSLEYTGLLQEVREYCSEYGLPDVIQNQLLKKDIDNTIKRKATREGWLSLKSSSKVLMRWTPEKKSDRQYFSYNRLESKLMLCLCKENHHISDSGVLEIYLCKDDHNISDSEVWKMCLCKDDHNISYSEVWEMYFCKDDHNISDSIFGLCLLLEQHLLMVWFGLPSALERDCFLPVIL